MKKVTFVKIAGALICLSLAIYFWPAYTAQLPKSSQQSQQAVLAQLENVSQEASLQLMVQPDDGIEPIYNLINLASKTIDVVIYQLQDQEIQKALAQAQKRGVSVRVILQNINNFGKRPNQQAYDFLKSQGVQVIWARSYFTLTHQKTFIIDDKAALIMTFNLNPRYYDSSRDFAILNTDTQDVAHIRAAFESDWNGWQKTADPGKDLVWSPGSASALLALINSANMSLDVYALEMADPRIEEAITKAALRNVKVRLVLTYDSAWKNALNRLAAAGVLVRTFSAKAPLYIHAKAMIVDGKKAFVGSENFSVQSLDFNRELGILISRPDVIESLEATFEADWGKAKIFTPSSTKTAESNIIKLSTSGICHGPDSSSYQRTTHFTAYATIELCLAAGGRLPKSSELRNSPR